MQGIGKRMKDCQPWGLLHNLARISASLNSRRKEAGETGDIRGRWQGGREERRWTQRNLQR